MNITIPDDLIFKDATKEFQKKWLDKEEREGESLSMFAKRIGVERSNLYKVFKKLNKLPESIKQSKKIVCLFCDSTKNLEAHHIEGRKNGDQTLFLCDHCHYKFHFLNRMYLK